MYKYIIRMNIHILAIDDKSMKFYVKPNGIPSIHNVIIHTSEINIFRENWEINIYDVNIFQVNRAIKFHKKTVWGIIYFVRYRI